MILRFKRIEHAHVDRRPHRNEEQRYEKMADDRDLVLNLFGLGRSGEQ